MSSSWRPERSITNISILYYYIAIITTCRFKRKLDVIALLKLHVICIGSVVFEVTRTIDYLYIYIYVMLSYCYYDVLFRPKNWCCCSGEVAYFIVSSSRRPAERSIIYLNIKDIIICRFDQHFDIVGLLKPLLPIFGTWYTSYAHIVIIFWVRLHILFFYLTQQPIGI